MGRQTKLLAVILTLVFSVSSCKYLDDDDSESSTDGGGGSGSTPAVSASSGLTTVVGQAFDPSKQATGASDANQSSVVVQAQLLDASGNELLTNPVVVTTDSDGLYQLDLLGSYSATPASVVITYSKDGFLEGEKVISLSAGQLSAQIPLPMSELTASTVSVASITDNLVVASDGVPRWNLGLVRNSSGEVSIRQGSGLASVAADEDVMVDISMPVSRIESSVEAVTSRIAYFDSSSSTDIQNFPGEFEGFGDPNNAGGSVDLTATGDAQDNYRLISSTFSQLILEDQDGNVLNLESEASAAADEPVIIKMMVPDGSYGTINKDADTNTDGIQVPIFVYDSGQGWRFVGNGTLVNDLDNVYGGTDFPFSNGETFDEANNELDITPAVGSITLFARVVINSANQWLRWINIDWPIQTGGGVVDVCLTGSVTYTGADNEPYSGHINVRMPDGGFNYTYVDNGQYRFETSVISNADTTDPTKWALDVFNFRTQKTEQFTTLPNPLVTGTDCNQNIDHQLANPWQCTITGTVTALDGTVVANKVVVAKNASNQSFAVTDSNGAYSLKTLCVTQTVSALGQSQSVSAAQLVDLTEEVNFTESNLPPKVSLSGRSEGSINMAYRLGWYAFDPNGDDVQPAELVCLVNGVAQTCPITETGTNSWTLNFTSAGTYTLQVSASDGTDTGTASKVVTVHPEGNKPPQIISFSASSTIGTASVNETLGRGDTVEIIQGQSATIAVRAFDRNGDVLTYSWTTTPDVSPTCDGNSCQIDTSSSGSVVYAVTVSDASSSDTSSVTVQVKADSPPTVEEVVAFPSPALALESDTNDEPIFLFAFIEDDFTPLPSLTQTWQIYSRSGETETLVDITLEGDSNDIIPARSLPIGSYRAQVMVTDLNAAGETGQTTTPATTEGLFSVTPDQPPTVKLATPTPVLVVTESDGAASNLVVTVEADDDVTTTESLTFGWTLAPELPFTLADDQQSITVLAADIIPSVLNTDGTLIAQVLVTDEKGNNTESSITIRTEAPTAPVISNLEAEPRRQNANANDTNPVEIVVRSSVLSDHELTFNWAVSPSVPFEVSESKRKVTFAAGTVPMSEYVVTLTVTDPFGLVTEQTVDFTVLEPSSGDVGVIIE